MHTCVRSGASGGGEGRGVTGQPPCCGSCSPCLQSDLCPTHSIPAALAASGRQACEDEMPPPPPLLCSGRPRGSASSAPHTRLRQ